MRALFGSPDDGRRHANIERFGESAVPASLAESILFDDPKRAKVIAGIRAHLEHFTKEEKKKLVDRVLVRLALFIWDLPASEKTHHYRSWGLLDHLLEVASKTVAKLSRSSFRFSRDPVVDHQERPAWIYAGFILALLHDIGKVLDLSVALPDGSDAFNPRSEPLASFCSRNHLAHTGPEFWTWKRGRGQRGHERHGPSFYFLVLPNTVTHYLGTRLDLFGDLYYMDQNDPEAQIAFLQSPEPIRQILEVVREFDHASSERSYHTEERQVAKDARPPRRGSRGDPKRSKSEVSPPKKPTVRGASVSSVILGAIAEGVRSGAIDVNVRNGLLFGGDTKIALIYPTTFYAVIKILHETGAVRDRRVKALIDPVDRTVTAEKLARELAQHGLLFRDPRDNDWEFRANLAFPGGKHRSTEAVLLDSEVLGVDVERFCGTIEFHGSEGPVVLADFGPAALPPAYARPQAVSEAPEAPEETEAEECPELIQPEADVVHIEDVRVDPGERSKREEYELQPANLMKRVYRALKSGYLSRNGDDSDAYIRNDYIHLIWPQAFIKLVQRIKIGNYNATLGFKILKVLLSCDQVVPASKKKTIVRIKTRPDAGGACWAVKIRTNQLLSKEELAQLGTWDFEVTRADDRKKNNHDDEWKRVAG